MPAEFRQKETWQHVSRKLNEAARGADTVHVVVALRVLMLEGVECRAK